MRGILLKAPNRLFLSHNLKKPSLEKINIKVQGENCINANFDLLIKVIAIGINRIDILIKQNKYPSFPKDQNLGIEISGTVEESTCEKFKKNDRVCSLLKYNGYNEYVLTTSKHTIKLSNTLSFIEGASLMESWLTAYKLVYCVARFPLIDSNSILPYFNSKESAQNANNHPNESTIISSSSIGSSNSNNSSDSSNSNSSSDGSNSSSGSNSTIQDDKRNESISSHLYIIKNSKKWTQEVVPLFSENEVMNVLVYGALSSVGVCLLQILNLEKQRGVVRINKIIAVTSEERKGQKALDLGATNYVFHNKDDFVDSVLKITNKVNVIFDCVGKSMFQKNIQICDVDTLWILYGLLGGSKLTDFHLIKLVSKRINLLNTTLYERTDAYKENLINSFEQHLLPLINKKILRCCIHDVMAIDEIEKAHSIIEQNKNIGKVVCIF